MKHLFAMATVLMSATLAMAQMSEDAMLERLDGQWQADLDAGNFRTDAAFELFASRRWVRALKGSDMYSGEIDNIAIVGETAVIKFGGKYDLIVFPQEGENRIQATIAGGGTITFKRASQ